jgi:hypothetical protein
MRINSRKIRKILGRVWTAPKRIFETFCTQEPLDASNKGFFLYYIPCKENKCWKIFKITIKSLFNYSFHSHPEIGNFRV